MTAGGDVVEHLVGLVHVRARTGARLVVAVDGADGAGKSTLAAALVRRLREVGVPAAGASLDGFHRPRALRYRRGRDDPDAYFEEAFDLAAAVDHLLRPWRVGGSWVAAVHDVRTDAVLDLDPAPVPAAGVLVVDGVFLLRPELRDWWDLVVRLEAPAEVRFRRMAERDGSPPDPDDPRNARYRLAHERYERGCRPAEHADVVVDSGGPVLRLAPSGPG